MYIVEDTSMVDRINKFLIDSCNLRINSLLWNIPESLNWKRINYKEFQLESTLSKYKLGFLICFYEAIFIACKGVSKCTRYLGLGNRYNNPFLCSDYEILKSQLIKLTISFFIVIKMHSLIGSDVV